MTDLELAKRNLAGHTICLCKDGKLLTSDKRGISPMMDFIEEGRDVTGYSVADKIVGKAAAFLFVLEQPIISDGEIIISFPFETGDRLPLVVDNQTVPFKFLYLLFISEINLIAH